MASADPGGGGPSDLTNLQETFNQQQAKLSALKELVRNADQSKSTANAHEKAKNIAQRLTNMKSKAIRSRESVERKFESEVIETTHFITPDRRGDDEESMSSQSFTRQQSVPSTPIMRAKSETPGSEKIQLLRQQMEQNRQKMAEREHSKRGIEEMVTQLKAKFDITQMSLEKSSQLGKSIGDLSMLSSGKGGLTKSTQDLTFTPAINLDKERIRNLQRKIIDLEHRLKEKDTTSDNNSDQSKKIKELENKILDLEENLKEKECVIDARTQAVSLMTENLSLKGKNAIDMVEETKQEMFKMQNKFIHNESELKSDIEILKIEIDDKNSKIENLEEKITILENNRFDLTMKNSELQAKLSDTDDYTTKLSELNKLNEALQVRITEMEGQRFDVITTDNDETNEARIKELEEEIVVLNKKLENSSMNDSEILEKYENLRVDFDRIVIENNDLKSRLSTLDESLNEKTIEYKVLQANFSVIEEKLKSTTPKSLFSKTTDEDAEGEINKLKQQLDESNKSAIKTKLKMKQLQKQIDQLKKSSNLHQDVVRLTEENQSLQQKLVELEEEKGALQLRLVAVSSEDDNEHNPNIVELSSTAIGGETSDLESKIKFLEHTCQNQTSAIQLLEEQKIDMTQDLQETKTELTSLKDQIKELDQQETVRVTTHYNEIEFEEKLEKYRIELSDLQRANNDLTSEVENLKSEKKRYVTENIELLDKLEKISMEKGSSSSESIEIVASLTQQEKAEIEEYEKMREKSKSAEESTAKGGDTDTIMDDEEVHELSDSLVKLREESSELMHKIDLFTTERNEVLEKMEILRMENIKLKENIDRLRNENEALITNKMETKPIEVDVESMSAVSKGLETEVEAFKKIKDQKVKKMMRKLVNEATKVNEAYKNVISEYRAPAPTVEPNIAEIDDLKTQIAIKTSEIDRQEKAFDSAQSEIDRLNQTLKDTELKLTELMEHEKKSIESIEDLNKSKLILQQQVDELDGIKVQLSQSAIKTTEKESEINELHNENDRLNQEIQKSTITLKDYELRLKSSDEQLEIFKTLVAEQKQQLISVFTEHEQEMDEKLREIERLNAATAAMENVEVKSDDMMDNLRTMLDKQEEDLHYKQETIDTLNGQIIELYKNMEDSSNQMIIRQDELQAELDQKNTEMLKLHQQIENNQKVVEKLEHELREKIKIIDKLSEKNDHNDDNDQQSQIRIRELEAKNKEQLEKMKKFAANLKKKVTQCNELEEKLAKLDTSAERNVELNEMKNNAELLTNKLAEKDRQIEDGQQNLQRLEDEMNRMRIELSKMDVTLVQSENSQHELIELRNELSRQSAIIAEHNIAALQNTNIAKIEMQSMELDRQEKALDSAQTEIENLNRSLSERDVKLSETIENHTKELNQIQDDLKKSNIKIEKCKAIIKERTKEIQRLNNQADELRAQIETLTNQITEKDTEPNNGDRSIERLNAKVQENCLYIETIETENSELKQKVEKLQDEIQVIEEERYRLKQENDSLDNELYERSQDFRRNEEDLEDEIDHLKSIEKKLIDEINGVKSEKSIIVGQLEMAQHNVDELTKKLSHLQSHVSWLETEKQPELERLNDSMREQLTKQDQEIKRLHGDFEKKIYEKKCEIDEIESSYADTIQSVQSSKREMEEHLEKLRDENVLLQDEIVQLKESLHNFEQIKSDLERELTWKNLENENLTQDQLELNTLRQQAIDDQQIHANYVNEIDVLQQQLANLESKQLQVTENTKLKEMLQAKEQELLTVQSELTNVRRNIVRQQSQNEIDNVLQVAEDHVRSLQNSPALQQFSFDEMTKIRHTNEKHIETLQMELEELKLYTSDLEERFKNVHILREESIRQLADKTKLNDDLKEINRNNEMRIVELLQQTTTRQESPPPVIDVTSTSVAVPSFDSSVFFGSVAEETPFDESLIVSRTATTVSATQPQASETNQPDNRAEELDKLRQELEKLQQRNIDLQLKYDQEIQQILTERDTLVRNLNELRTINEKLREEKSSSPKQRVKRDVDQSLETASKFFTDSPSLFDIPSLQQPDASANQDEIFRNKTPVIEELIVPRQSYVCGPEDETDLTTMKPEDKPQSASMEILFDDQSWGWEAEPHSLDNFTIVKEAPMIQVVAPSHATAAVTSQHSNVSQPDENYNRLMEDNQNLTMSLNELRQQFEVLLGEKNSLNASVDQTNELRHENEQLRSSLSELNVKLGELSQEGIQLQSTIVTLRSEVEEMRKMSETSISELQEMTARNNELERSRTELTALYEEHKAIVERLENHGISLQRTIDEISSELNVTRLVVEQGNCSINELTSRNSELERHISEQKAIIERLETEKQIEPVVDTIVAAEVPLPSFNSSAFFQSDPSETQSPFDNEFIGRVPVVEEQAVSKHAYVCGPAAVVATQTDPVPPAQDEEWGWGSNDAVLEEQHQAATAIVVSHTPQSLPISAAIQSQVEIQEYRDKIDELELEKSRLEEEVVALKVKSGKLIKKFKDYKSEVEGRGAFKKSPSVESSDLDQAIQDELNKQVKSLEMKLKEAKADNEKMIAERENLVKRVDVLTAANHRMTEMKERQDNEIESCHYKIKELSGKLERLEEWGDDSNYTKDSPVKIPTTTSSSVQQQSQVSVTDLRNIEEFERKIDQLTAEIQDIRVDNDELQALLDEEKNNNRIGDGRIAQLQASVDSMRTEIETLTEELHRSKSLIFEKSNEINSLTNEIERMRTASLFQSLETPASIVAANPFASSTVDNQQKLDELENEVQSLHGQLVYKNSEISSLNERIEHLIREDQTQSLVQEILTKNHEINLLKSQVQELTHDKDELEHNLSIQLTQEELVKLKKELVSKDEKIKQHESERLDMENELKVLNDQVIASLAIEDKMKSVILELDVKTIEITELKNTLQELRNQQQQQPSTNVETQQTQNETTDQKLYELETKWKQYVMEREMQYNTLIESMGLQIEELKSKRIRSSEAGDYSHDDEDNGTDEFDNEQDKEREDTAPNLQIDENNPNTEETLKLREALEAQEMEIVTLKEQLAIRSAEYARLASQVDPFGQRSTSSITLFKDKPKPPSADENSEVIPRAELDLALYMLHQRDMRCEELTLELVHLLEERDTLQLKLSNSIRQIEDIRKRTGVEIDVSDTDSSEPKLNTTTERRDAPEDGSISDSETRDLRSKLNQLQGVSHARDKTLQEDRENRQRQMTQLQKDISNIPSEAVANLVGADYTLSRTSQSPSSVLFNWLMGKSTPKAP